MGVREFSTAGRRDNRSAHGIYSQRDPTISKSKKTVVMMAVSARDALTTIDQHCQTEVLRRFEENRRFFSGWSGGGTTPTRGTPIRNTPNSRYFSEYKIFCQYIVSTNIARNSRSTSLKVPRLAMFLHALRYLTNNANVQRSTTSETSFPNYNS